MPETPLNRLQHAYELHLPALRAFPQERVIQPRLDIAGAGAKLLGYLPRYEALLPKLIALPHTDKKLVEELATRAMAMVQAQSEYLTATAPATPLPELLERATTVRKQLLDTAPGLVAFGKLNQGAIDAILKGSGYIDLGMDLVALATLYRNSAAAIGVQSCVTPEFVAAAHELGAQVLTALGAKEAASHDVLEATAIRDRAYTYFMESYYEARRSLDYLLGDRDEVDLILPAIFSYKRAKPAEPAPAPDAVPAPAPAPVGGGVAPAPFRASAEVDPDSPFTSLAPPPTHARPDV